MPLGPRIFFSFVALLGAMIAFMVLGGVLNSNAIQGPLIGEDYLTDWAIWKYIAGSGAALVTMLCFWLLGRKKSDV